MHATCWDIFTQNDALLARGTAVKPRINALGRALSIQRIEEDGRGLRIDWAQHYGGVERFWYDGWSAPGSLVANILEWVWELDYFVKDPLTLEGLDNVLETPPLTSTAGDLALFESTSSGNCCFSRLPEELLIQIISLLPTESVNAVRLASRSVASVYLATSYWRSRFDFPNELSHIKLPPKLHTGHIDGLPIDWSEFCHRLLYPDSADQNTENRNRISGLIKKLLVRISPNSFFQDRYEWSASLTQDLFCRQCLTVPEIRISGRASVVFEELRPAASITRISASFRTVEGAQILEGLAFQGPNNTLKLGKYEDGSAVHVHLEDFRILRSLVVGVVPTGIVGLKFQTQKSTESIDADEGWKEFVIGSFKGKVVQGELYPYRGSAIQAVHVDLRAVSDRPFNIL